MFSQFIQQLPESRNEVFSFDTQPLMASGSMEGLMVNVNGMVRYAQDPPRFWHQQFILTDDSSKPDTFYVSSDCFRFT